MYPDTDREQAVTRARKEDDETAYAEGWLAAVEQVWKAVQPALRISGGPAPSLDQTKPIPLAPPGSPGVDHDLRSRSVHQQGFRSARTEWIGTEKKRGPTGPASAGRLLS